jgi:hypothetical protein
MADDFDQTDPNSPNYIPPVDTTPTNTSTPPDDTGKAAQPPAILEQNQASITKPVLPEGGTAVAVEQTPGAGELSDPYGHNIAAPTPVNVVGGDAVAAQKAPEVKREDIEAAIIGANNAPKVQAAQGTVKENELVTAQTQEGLSEPLKQTFKTFNEELNSVGVDPNSTVQEQYKKLTDFSGGMPGWAQGAITKANQVMAARGLGNSSAAAGAITAEVLKAALPIAVQDASVFQTMQIKKLDLKAQSTFLQAGYISQLDMKNLDNRQQAAVVNAKTFLDMDFTNLSLEQQAAVVNSQNRLQVLLSDQASTNATRQFNATGQQQVQQFNAAQANSVAMFNSEQLNSMTRFNAGETNSVAKFNEAMLQDAWKFNVNNQTLIDQANVAYLRNINTNNTAAKNAANLTNSTNLVNISNTAIANQIQMLRDQTAFSFQMGENDKDRAQQTAMLQLQNQQWFQRYNTEQKDSFWKSVGTFIAGAAGTIIDNVTKKT